MRSSIWFLFAAVVSVYSMAFAEDTTNESIITAVVSQERQEHQENTTSTEQESEYR